MMLRVMQQTCIYDFLVPPQRGEGFLFSQKQLPKHFRKICAKTPKGYCRLLLTKGSKYDIIKIELYPYSDLCSIQINANWELKR